MFDQITSAAPIKNELAGPKYKYSLVSYSSIPGSIWSSSWSSSWTSGAVKLANKSVASAWNYSVIQCESNDRRRNES